MFDSRIFYLQMTHSRHRPQLVAGEKPRNPRPTSARVAERTQSH